MNTLPAAVAAQRQAFPFRAFFLTCLVVSVWVNASEVFRYFAFVMPTLRTTLSMVPNVAPMNLGVFLIWGAWDSLLVVMTVLIYWLWSAQFGRGLRSVFAAGTLSWLFFFVLFWVGLLNTSSSGGIRYIS